MIPTVDDLKDEAYSVLVASADTTGNAMTVAAYNVVSNPKIFDRVKKELEAEFPNPNERLSFVRLETLPYLTAVIKEGLRYVSPFIKDFANSEAYHLVSQEDFPAMYQKAEQLSMEYSFQQA